MRCCGTWNVQTHSDRLFLDGKLPSSERNFDGKDLTLRIVCM